MLDDAAMKAFDEENYCNKKILEFEDNDPSQVVMLQTDYCISAETGNSSWLYSLYNSINNTLVNRKTEFEIRNLKK